MSSIRAKLRQLQRLTQVSKQTAEELLEVNHGSVNAAADYYFSNQSKFRSSKKKKGDENKIRTIFKKYADDDDPNLIQEKYSDFLRDIEVEEDGLGSFGLPWKFNASDMGVIEEKEFVTGLSEAGADSIPKIKAWSKNVLDELESEEGYKEFYNWMFEYLKEDSKRKTIDLDISMEVWQVIMKDKFTFLDKWLEFLKQETKPKINKDVWSQLVEFAFYIKDDFSNWDPAGAW
eukprot:CAMPEP_0184488560 /NCGR_PEP_ID=MMETSP0113_2-20130426/12419_1 /TAXON_ID=91329 /ORGANISM="Norrisiella sphaerica, Strain BC52" /LENGTH=231 /DNA_ID=CAMNT_0026871421 /DNA_START=112 /DNA_END=804 /DNA_ORIENTATION=-